MEDKSEQDKIKNKQEEKALNQNRKEIEQDKAPSENNKLEQDIIPSVLKQQANWDALFFYQKSDVIYQLTFAFCDRFIHLYKDRTRDQVIQAARSCKQNIVEGSEDGKTSTEMEVNLLNVARSSRGELKEDDKDFITSRKITLWNENHPRFANMQEFTKKNNSLEQYEDYFYKWTAEEMANIGLTLCYQVDAMMFSYLKKLESEFVSQGGIKERMHAARTGYRQEQDDKMKALEKKVAEQEKTINDYQEANAQWQAKYEELRQKATEAYSDLRKQLAEAKKRLGEE